ncbi:MAG: class I SAM-dependent methyltransferase [Candidatus Methylumidiphilus sp.]
MTLLVLDTPELAKKYEDLSDKQFEHGKLLIADLAIKPGEKVLDVGSGTGRLTEYVADIVGLEGEAVGVDPLPLRIDIAQQKRRANLSFGIAPAEDLSQFADASFDAAYFNSVFHWLEDKHTALTEVARVLKPGGRLGISAASKERPHSLQGVVRDVLSREPFNQHGEQGFDGPLFKLDVAETIALLDTAGFSVTSAEIKTFTDYFDAPQTVIDFSLSSSFGNFLGKLPAEVKLAAIEAIKIALETLRTPKGIELQRNVIFTLAVKH